MIREPTAKRVPRWKHWTLSGQILDHFELGEKRLEGDFGYPVCYVGVPDFARVESVRCGPSPTLPRCAQ